MTKGHSSYERHLVQGEKTRWFTWNHKSAWKEESHVPEYDVAWKEEYNPLPEKSQSGWSAHGYTQDIPQSSGGASWKRSEQKSKRNIFSTFSFMFLVFWRFRSEEG